MSFVSRELSEDLGEPINLYRFKYGPRSQDVYCYTDSETDIVAFGRVFKAIPIKRSSINSSGTTDKTTLSIEMPRTEALPGLFLVYPPSFTVTLTIWQSHVGEPESQHKVLWSGIVLSCAREGSLLARVECEPATVSMQRVGLRRNYQYMCPHVLYGSQCKASKAAATTDTTAAEIDGRFVRVNMTGSESVYTGGLLEWTTTQGLKEYRTILAVQTVIGSLRLTLSGLPLGLEVDMAVKVVKGCNHRLSHCEDVHNNILNFGGQPWIPTKNPLGRTTPFL